MGKIEIDVALWMEIYSVLGYTIGISEGTRYNIMTESYFTLQEKLNLEGLLVSNVSKIEKLLSKMTEVMDD
jgi:hypothetical protein